jgi:hypothetical protein
MPDYPGAGVAILPISDFNALCSELDDYMKDKPEPPPFDWSQCPKDTVFEVDGRKVYFSHYRDGYLYFYSDGKTSHTGDAGAGWRFATSVTSNHFKLAHNPPLPWFGGPQPVPDGARVNLWFRDGDTYTDFAKGFKWWNTEEPESDDIIAYEILGENDD